MTIRAVFHAEDGSHRTTERIFRNHRQLDDFLDNYENYGGFRRFSCDRWGNVSLTSTASNDDATFKSIYRDLYPATA